MSKEKEMATKNKILEYRIGSHLYGTNTPSSDEDYSGVFIADETYYLGLHSIEQIDLSEVSKNETGKNNSDAVDRVCYELRKFIRLAMENNPNVLEQLFVNGENILSLDEFGAKLLAAKHLFPHKGLKHKFCAYAYQQRKKMVIRTDKFYELKNAQEWLEKFNQPTMYMVELKDKNLPFMMFKEKHIHIGDLDFEMTRQLKWVKKKIEERLEKVGNRKELYLSKGYDTKFASHTIRLLLEVLEILETGNLEFPLKDRQVILDIKEGKWTITEVLDYSYQLEQEIESLYEKSFLPKNPQIDKINDLSIALIKSFLYG